jgi:hypothetical protein
MNKTLLVLIFIIIYYIPLLACNTCGCSGGAIYTGVLPQYNNHFIGVRWYNRSFNSKHELNDNNVSKEYFNTIELIGRFFPSKRVQILVFVPYNIFAQKELNTSTKTIGIGDPSIIASYSLIRRGDNLNQKWKHLWFVGAGLKLPVGTYSFKNGLSEFNPNIQNGTGSTDFIFYTSYTIRKNKIGSSFDFTYKYNLSNNLGYQFGNRTNAQFRLFYLYTKKKLSVLPQVGFLFEHAQKDNKFKGNISNTGGYGLYAHIGLDIYISRFAIGANVQPATFQKISNGYVTSLPRIQTHFLINF